MGVKNNTKYFRMQREHLMRCAKLNYYQQVLKEEEQYSSEIPVYSENSNPEENKEFKFHWTRLSINSNSSCVID